LVNAGWILTTPNPNLPDPPIGQTNIINGVVACLNSDDRGSPPNAAIDALAKVFPVPLLLGTPDIPKGTIVLYVPPKTPYLDPSKLTEAGLGPQPPSPFIQQTKGLENDLGAYAGQGVVLMCPRDDKIAETWLFELRLVFRSAKWVIRNDSNDPDKYSFNYAVPPSNVAIGINELDAKSPKIVESANTILNGFKKQKIIAATDSIELIKNDKPSDGDVFVLIGLSPFKLVP
jgi:hypothetical protein